MTEADGFYGDADLNPKQYGFGRTLGSCAKVLEKYHCGEYFRQ